MKPDSLARFLASLGMLAGPALAVHLILSLAIQPQADLDCSIQRQRQP